MAKIVENPEGHRMVRLSTEDVLMVVSLYQQQLYTLQQRTYDGIKERLNDMQCYLPEDV